MSLLEEELGALAGLPTEQLKEKWSAMEGTVPPSAPPALLRRLIAQRLQERRHGALPVLVARELKRLETEGPGAERASPRVTLPPGTRLVREWNGQTITVEVLEKGFSYADRKWRSLSEIARHVTGAHWSGPRFFGLNGNA